MSAYDPFHGSPRLCKIKLVVIDGESVIDRRELFALCKGKEDRDRLIYQIYAEKRDAYGSNVEIFTDYKWEALTLTDVRFQAAEGQILMWTIRCNGKVMGRMKTLTKASKEFRRMFKERRKELEETEGIKDDKWTLHREQTNE